MEKTILIVGSGGRNKYEYLKWLESFGATVILLEPENAQSDCAPKCKTYYAPFTRLEAVVQKAKEISTCHSIVAVDTIYELAMEHAAFVRHALDLPGLTPELIKIGRSKSVMAGFMSSRGIRTPSHITFDEGADLREIKQKMKLYGDMEWILRPDNLGSNIGIRRIKTLDDLELVFDNAQNDMSNHQYRKLIFNNTNRWIVSQYIPGSELEAEVCIHKGETVFCCQLFKTVVLERQWGIEENRCVTPVPWLTATQLNDMNIQIRMLAQAIYTEIMKPCGRDTMITYIEFRLDNENQAHVIEFAFRNGGYLNPTTIKESTGIDPYYLSAAATMGIEPKLADSPIRCASGYQSIYSDRKGTFGGVKGIRNLPGITVKKEVPLGHEISVPHSEILLNVIATGTSAETVDRILNDSLREATVIVDGESIGVPLSPYVK
ncbi:MAG: ATP-grasp domain-containing protein [Pseudomonadota bacterium]